MASRRSTTARKDPQAIEKKRGRKCLLSPAELLAELACKQNSQSPQERRFGEDELRDTRERIACQYGKVK